MSRKKKRSKDAARLRHDPKELVSMGVRIHERHAYAFRQDWDEPKYARMYRYDLELKKPLTFLFMVDHDDRWFFEMWLEYDRTNAENTAEGLVGSGYGGFGKWGFDSIEAAAIEALKFMDKLAAAKGPN